MGEEAEKGLIEDSMFWIMEPSQDGPYSGIDFEQYLFEFGKRLKYSLKGENQYNFDKQKPPQGLNREILA